MQRSHRSQLYSLIRFGMILLFLWFSLWLWAEKLDETEEKSLITFATAIIAALGVERLAHVKEWFIGENDSGT